VGYWCLDFYMRWRIVAREQIRRLLDCLAEPSRSIACLLVSTGLRIGELLALRLRDADLGARVLHVRQTVYEGHFDEPRVEGATELSPWDPGRLRFSLPDTRRQ